MFTPEQVIVDVGNRGRHAECSAIQTIYRCKYKLLIDQDNRLLKRSKPIKPPSGCIKADHWIGHYRLQVAKGDPLHAL